MTDIPLESGDRIKDYTENTRGAFRLQMKSYILLWCDFIRSQKFFA